MHTLEHERDDDETPTRHEAPSGKWIIAVDRGQRLIESAIAKLEAGDDVEAAIAELRQARALVNGGAA